MDQHTQLPVFESVQLVLQRDGQENSNGRSAQGQLLLNVKWQSERPE